MPNLRRFIPKSVRNTLHYVFAWYGAVRYRFPSEEVLVVGITGTSGKSSTAYWLRQVLEAGGLRVGSLSTIDFYIAGENKLNDQKMTMLGRMQIQKYLREMVTKKCDVAIIEMTSEGAVQHRNKFINVDIMALTNFYPEHIESHGSFEKYKAAKKGLFAYVAHSKRKQKNDSVVPKIAIANGDIAYAAEFLNYPFDEKWTFGVGETKFPFEMPGLKGRYTADAVRSGKDGITFTIEGKECHPKMYGEHNASNLLCVTAIARAAGLSLDTCVAAINQLTGAPGRVEFIREAEEKGFQAIVDFAFEPVALAGLYEVVKILAPKRVIHVCGAAGGGRDVARRELIGRLAGEKADIVIVTNEDPYDDNPQDIIRMVARGVESAGKKLGNNLIEITDRREAIEKALSLAQPGDIVLVTGKGSEQAICVAGGKKIPWDDRVVVRESLVI